MHKVSSIAITALLLLSTVFLFSSLAEPMDVIPPSIYYAGGNGTVGDPFQISNVTQLQAINDDLNASYILINDIEAKDTVNWNGGKGFDPIGDEGHSLYNGTFNGAGYRIFNLTIDLAISDSYIGLFANLNDTGTVKNVGMENCSIKGGGRIGALVGNSYGGTIENCYSTGSIQGGTSMGGIVGFLNTRYARPVEEGNPGSRVRNCYSTASVTGTSNSIGGLVGVIWDRGSTITNSYCTGNVKGAGDYVGGFVGWNREGNIYNSYSTGVVNSSRPYVGGFVGKNGGVISNCYSRGNVNSTGDFGDLVGGFAGASVMSGMYTPSLSYCFSTGDAMGNLGIGGFVGKNAETPVTYCYSTGNASGKATIGGFAGFHTSPHHMMNCFSTGNAMARFNIVGGFVGDSVDGAYLNCYSIGNASGTSDVGGFVGCERGYSTYGNSFWDINASGTTSSDGATGLSTALMKQHTTYPKWDFVTVWDIVNSKTYPFLRFDTPMITISDTTEMDQVSEDNPCTFDFEAIVPFMHDEVNNITWNVSTNRNEWFSIDSISGTISGTPTNADVGDHEVEVTATDSRGRLGTYSYSLSVDNTDPEITTADNNTVVAGTLYRTDYDSSDDGFGTITWDHSSNASFLSLMEGGILSGIPTNSHTGTYWVNVSVDDGNGGTDSTNFTLEVKLDTDLDGIPDETDDDDDNDGTLDTSDAFPTDPTEWMDTDGDGTGNNADPDDDNDGWFDTLESVVGTDRLNKTSTPPDMDGDNITDLLDPDTDGDGYFNVDDYYPYDPLKWEKEVVNITEYINQTMYENQTIYQNQIKYNNKTIYSNGTITETIETTVNKTVYDNKTIDEIYLEDSDEDGMPDCWELLYGLDPDDPTDADDDRDNDGKTNLEEYNDGTSPTKSEDKDDAAGSKSDVMSNIPLYVLIGILAIIATAMIVLFVFKKPKRDVLPPDHPEEDDEEPEICPEDEIEEENLEEEPEADVEEEDPGEEEPSDDDLDLDDESVEEE